MRYTIEITDNDGPQRRGKFIVGLKRTNYILLKQAKVSCSFAAIH